MKKIFCLLLVFVSLFSLTSCKNVKSEARLSYGEKYILSSHAGDGQTSYYIFENDGTARYYNRENNNTKKYIYKIVDEENMIFLFYDGDNKGSTSTNECIKLMYTEDFVMSATTGTMYIAESFLNDELHNFGK